MNKPFTMAVNEFKEELVKLINSSNLPAYAIKNELEKVYQELSKIDQEEIEKYSKSLGKGVDKDDKK